MQPQGREWSPWEGQKDWPSNGPSQGRVVAQFGDRAYLIADVLSEVEPVVSRGTGLDRCPA